MNFEFKDFIETSSNIENDNKNIGIKDLNPFFDPDEWIEMDDTEDTSDLMSESEMVNQYDMGKDSSFDPDEWIEIDNAEDASDLINESKMTNQYDMRRESSFDSDEWKEMDNHKDEIIDKGQEFMYNDKRMDDPIQENKGLDEEKELKIRLPEKNGTWEGEAGNSKWIPDSDYVPLEKSKNPDKPYSNPDKLSWQEILSKYGIDGIYFVNGFPRFDTVSKGTVEIEDFETGGSDAKNRNFKKADIELAKQKGCSPEEVKKWRIEHNYTWHECEDKKTMQKVPNEIHANIPHNGGRSQ